MEDIAGRSFTDKLETDKLRLFRPYLNVFSRQQSFFQTVHKMTPTLGKRKRQAARHTEDGQEEHEHTNLLEQEAQDILRRHFEAKFKPLPQIQKKAEVVNEEEPEVAPEEDSEWGGISDGEQDAVQIVEHTDGQSRIVTMPKDELKSYMVRPSVPQSQSLLTVNRALNHLRLHTRYQ